MSLPQNDPASGETPITPAGQPSAASDLVSPLRNLIMGFRTTQLLCVAARLGLADHLREGPQTAPHLAGLVGANPDAVHRLLRALGSLGLVTETGSGAFALTPSGELLQNDVPGSLRSVAILYGEEWLWQVYGQMLHSVRTGKAAFEQVHGQSLYGYLAQHPAAAASFHQAMSGYSDLEAEAILRAYDFSRARTVVDVGGGRGRLLQTILEANEHLSGILFDLPPVLERALPGPVAPRLQGIAGDFFAEVPAGGDVYILKSVLHNWQDAQAVKILQNCRRAMGKDARLLVAERIIPPGDTPSEAKLFDINMLVVTGGQERTEAEYRALFHAAGLKLERVFLTHSPVSLLEGVPL